LKVEQVANLAQLEYLKFDLDKGYKTLVGERGMRLSGGQRQRIGIARALYKNADVIIFDEATSALDNKTERLIMESIENLNKDITILIIAHRLSTLKNCDKIFELSNGSVITSKVALEK
jgi:ATP-binding cassette subfamily B protein